MYKYIDIINDVDVIQIRSVDVVSIYQNFLKILVIELQEIKDSELFNELTWNNFKRNSGFSLVLNRFIFYLFYYLKDKKYTGKDNKKEQAFLEIIDLFKKDNNFDYIKNQNKELIINKAKDIFKLANIDGSTKDIITLVSEFDILNNESKQKQLNSLYFIFEAFNGCDIPD